MRSQNLAKGQPFSVRLEDATEKVVEAEARRTRRSTHLSMAQVRLAVAYRAAYPQEIDEVIADNRRPLDELQALFPFIDVVEV